MRSLRATYRLQFGPEFTFEQAREILPYLSALGISHLYASPIFASRPGSTHGYDVVDHGAVSQELGGEEGLRELAKSLQAVGMGLILDIVPNHSGVGGSENDRWLGLLEFGESGPDSRWFDVDWARGPLMLPILGETLAEAIAAGELRPFWDPERGQIAIHYHAHRLPLAPTTVARLISATADRLGGSETMRKLATSWEELNQKPSRYRIATLRQALRAEMTDPQFQTAILGLLQEELADPDEAMTVQRQLFEQQSWRLAHWRIARDELNYRRFFSITDLAALRVEDPEVFQAIHALPKKLLEEGVIDGLRVDHIDGLADPAGYSRTLRDIVGPEVTIHVEKILGRGEVLRPWPIDGTTGYEYLNLINGLFIDSNGYARLSGHAAQLGLSPPPTLLGERVAAAKREILDHGFVTELGKLTKLAKILADRSLQTADFTDEAIRRGLSDLLVVFPVYRSYLTAAPCDPEDRLLVEAAQAALPADTDPWQQAVRQFIVASLTEAEADEIVVEFRQRFQQLTAPLMAKGYEDTELYRHIVLLSANEVGGHLEDPGVTVDEFHAEAARLQENWPKSLIPLATHDTKWGADARARLNLLTECATEWIEVTGLWSDAAGAARRERDGQAIPSRLDEARLFQTLLGCWPMTADRLEAFFTKAIREARVNGSWENPDQEYEAGALSFAREILGSAELDEVKSRILEFVQLMTAGGRLNSLAQTIIQLTMPGIPDIYWGGEFWDHALVDPDNRRPVSWDRRRLAQDALKPPGEPIDLAAAEGDLEGVVKLAVIQRLLDLRRRLPALFEAGAYLPMKLDAASEIQARWLCFAREIDGTALVVVVPVRGLAATAARHQDTGSISLPESWHGRAGREVISGTPLALGNTLDLATALARNPVAVIVFQEDSPGA